MITTAGDCPPAVVRDWMDARSEVRAAVDDQPGWRAPARETVMVTVALVRAGK
jgi:hypothetical protein